MPEVKRAKVRPPFMRAFDPIRTDLLALDSPHESQRTDFPTQLTVSAEKGDR